MLALLALGCEARSPVRAEADAALERLIACADASERAFTAEPGSRESTIAGWLSSGGGACSAEVYRGCAGDATLHERAETEHIPAIALACIEAYCGRFTAAPALCAGREALRGADVAAARGAAEEFLAAKLALDLGLERGDPRVQPIARAFAHFWTVEAMRHAIDEAPPVPPRPLPLELEVLVDARGFTITGRHIEATTLPADASKPLLAFDRWDYAALGRTALALKGQFPGESSVAVRTGDGVPMEALIQTMDALRGEDCGPGPDHVGCLFWQPYVPK